MARDYEAVERVYREAAVAGTAAVTVTRRATHKIPIVAPGRPLHATRDYERIAREILEEAADVDAREDQEFGERRGDELRPELSTP